MECTFCKKDSTKNVCSECYYKRLEFRRYIKAYRAGLGIQEVFYNCSDCGRRSKYETCNSCYDKKKRLSILKHKTESQNS